MKFNFVYITCQDKEEAKAIGKRLVESRLAACVNIIDKMESIYWWQGKIEESQEAVLIAKTREALVGQVIKQVKRLHSYDNPCIVSLPIEKGSPEYLKWIEKETG